MKLNFNGSFELSVPIDKAFDFLTDPNSIGNCIPDLEELKVVDSKNFNVKIKVGIGFLKGSFDLKCSIPEGKRPSHSKFLVEGSGAGSKAKIEISFDLKKKSEGVTQMNWNADAELSGLISGIGEMLLRKINEAKVKEIFDKIKEKLEK